MSTTPIGDHAFLSDRHSSALVTRDGSVDWLVFPRFDSPSVLGRILGDEAGHWQVSPVEPYEVDRRYVEGTLVLETTFRTGGGTLVLTDCLGVGENEDGHRLGIDVPHMLVRRLECTAGEVEVVLDFAPRPEYGLIVPLLEHVEDGVTARGGAEWLVLTTTANLTLDEARATGRLRLREGERTHLALQRSTLEEEPAHVWAQDDLARVVDRTVEGWQKWAAEHQSYDGPWADLVHHSGRVLEGLSFQPSGAVVAAATTSLPEAVGGSRNWDYRYAWVRDASFTLDALWVAACPDEADDFFAFMTTAAASGVGPGRGLQIMFGVGGEHDLTERELPHLPGWRDSAPVRVGNGAWDQTQIDVYGEILAAAHRLREQLGALDDQTKAFLVACADAAAEQWSDRDQGIWEMRGDPQHFLYSKLMCWVALDRAIELAEMLDASGKVPSWTETRDAVRERIEEGGWNEQVGAYTQYLGGESLDASALMLPIVGFLPGDHPRMLATLEAVERRLVDDRGLVRRYLTDGGADGLEGDEGSFLICTFWLAHALALAGRADRATEVFERAIACCNDVGLLSEEVDTQTGELLGNMPQAFSHIGLVNAAWAISQAKGMG